MNIRTTRLVTVCKWFRRHGSVQHTHTHLQMEVPKLLLRISAIEGQVPRSTDLPLQKLPYAVLGLIRSRAFPCNHSPPRCRPWTTLHPHPVHRLHLPSRPNPLLLLLPPEAPIFFTSSPPSWVLLFPSRSLNHLPSLYYDHYSRSQLH